YSASPRVSIPWRNSSAVISCCSMSRLKSAWTRFSQSAASCSVRSIGPPGRPPRSWYPRIVCSLPAVTEGQYLLLYRAGLEPPPRFSGPGGGTPGEGPPGRGFKAWWLVGAGWGRMTPIQIQASVLSATGAMHPVGNSGAQDRREIQDHDRSYHRRSPGKT